MIDRLKAKENLEIIEMIEREFEDRLVIGGKITHTELFAFLGIPADPSSGHYVTLMNRLRRRLFKRRNLLLTAIRSVPGTGFVVASPDARIEWCDWHNKTAIKKIKRNCKVAQKTELTEIKGEENRRRCLVYRQLDLHNSLVPYRGMKALTE